MNTHVRIQMKPAMAGLLLSALSMIGCQPDDDLTNGGGTPWDDSLILQNCMPGNLQTDLLAFYPFTSGSLDDFSGNNRHLSNPTSAMATADRNGNTGCAYSFEADNDEFLTRANPDFLNNLQAFSISLWYKADPLLHTGLMHSMAFRGEDDVHCPDTRGEWSMSIYDCGQPVFGYSNGAVWRDLGSLFPQYTCQQLADSLNGSWRHVVGVYDGNMIHIYHGGAQNTDIASSQCFNPQLMEDIGDLFFGKSFDGQLDDIAIWSRALSPGEVADLNSFQPCCQ